MSKYYFRKQKKKKNCESPPHREVWSPVWMTMPEKRGICFYSNPLLTFKSAASFRSGGLV